jgi:hypothetical protein
MEKMTLTKHGNMVAEGFTEVIGLINGLKKDMNEMKTDISTLKVDVSLLKLGQDDIILRLDEKANKIDLPGFGKKTSTR